MALKVTYFDIKGRAEATRLALSIGGIEFEDERIPFSEWKDRKTQTPFGQLPLFSIGDQVFAQSSAMLRYAGKLAGLYPLEDHMKALKIDMWLDCCVDLRVAISDSVHESDDAKKMAMRKKLAEETIPMWFERFSNAIEANPSKSGFLVGDSLTIADLELYSVSAWITSGMLDGIPASSMDKFASLLKHRELVQKIEAVREFEAKHRK